MGKAGRAEQAFPNAAPATGFGKVVSARCASVLLLAVGGFLSAAFMMLHLRASGGVVPDEPDILAGEPRNFSLAETDSKAS